MAKKADVIVEQDANKPVERIVLAQAIVDISTAAKKLSLSGLNRDAVITLISKSSGEPAYRVRTVLEAIEQLKRDYTTL